VGNSAVLIFDLLNFWILALIVLPLGDYDYIESLSRCNMWKATGGKVLSVYLSLYLPVYLVGVVYLCVYMSAFLSVCLSLSRFAFLILSSLFVCLPPQQQQHNMPQGKMCCLSLASLLVCPLPLCLFLFLSVGISICPSLCSYLRKFVFLSACVYLAINLPIDLRNNSNTSIETAISLSTVSSLCMFGCLLIRFYVCLTLQQ
jgi:hypothetical protein